jgi:dolichol-phosphate mannosyltransferase
VAAVGVVAFSLMLRLIYLGQAQLIPDEAYYWNYAQHMELSFLDHPPMVAWLIWLGTTALGNNEFGVRIGAFLCGLVTMGYLYALARNLYDKSTAMRALLLLAVLPITFASGILMTPDAPLIAAWAATLYYMERALVAGRSSAWLGMGVAFGLGLLSKYTLGLLGIAALLFVILDPTARRWMRRPHPYLAAVLALLLFSPVIIWNSDHEWGSFLFQSQRAQGIGNQFSIHYLILHMMILLTPVGLFAAVLALIPNGDRDQNPDACRRHLFIRTFTAVPLAVFVGLSLFGSPKFHWTGPVWLMILPTMAWMIGQIGDHRNVVRRLRAIWRPTIIVTMFLYAFALHYAVLGVPGAPYPSFTKHYFWREATSEIEQVVQEVRESTGQEPIIIGMSRWSVASALSFYNRSENRMEIYSRNLFGDESSMYDLWAPAPGPTTRPVILVGMSYKHLERSRAGRDLDPMLDHPGPIQYREVIRDQKPIRRIYYRIAEGYLGD